MVRVDEEELCVGVGEGHQPAHDEIALLRKSSELVEHTLKRLTLRLAKAAKKRAKKKRKKKGKKQQQAAADTAANADTIELYPPGGGSIAGVPPWTPTPCAAPTPRRPAP